MRILRNMLTEARFIRMLKGQKESNDQILWMISQGLGSDLPRAVIREMIDLYDRDKAAFIDQVRMAKGTPHKGAAGRGKSRIHKGAPKPLSLAAFRKLIEDNDLQTYRNRLLRVMRVGHQLIAGAKLPARQTAVGCRFRGRPALASDDEWPAWNGTAMQFLLQIDLARLPKRATGMFPVSGLLSFFCVPEWDYASPDAGRILFHKSLRGLVLRAAPDGVREFPARAMRVVPNMLCVPPMESSRFDALRIRGEAADCYSSLSTVSLGLTTYPCEVGEREG